MGARASSGPPATMPYTRGRPISEPALTAQHALSGAPEALGRPLAAFTPNSLLAPSRPSDGPSDRSTTTPTDRRPPHDLDHRHSPNPLRVARSRGPHRRSRFPGPDPGLGVSRPQRDNHAAAETLPGTLSHCDGPARSPIRPPQRRHSAANHMDSQRPPSPLSNPTTGPRPVTTGPFPAGRRSPPDGGQLPIPACRFSLQFCLVSGRSFLRRDQPFSFRFRRPRLDLLSGLGGTSILATPMHAFRFSQNPYWRTHPRSIISIPFLKHWRTPPPPRKSYPCLSTRSYLKL